MATRADIPRLEMLQVADMVAREKGIERDEVLEAMEQAIQKAGRAKYGLEHDIRAEIDRKTGEDPLLALVAVADPVENEATQMRSTRRAASPAEDQVGDFIIDELPPIDFGRVAAQTAKQVIAQRCARPSASASTRSTRTASARSSTASSSGSTSATSPSTCGRAEAILRRDEPIPRETSHGDRVRAYIFDVREETHRPQIFLSRTHPEFMAKLFAQEVPEIYDGIIEIKAVARDPGSRAKIAVSPRQLDRPRRRLRRHARQPRPGRRRGAAGREDRHHPVVAGPATFVVNALAPAEVTKVLMDEEAGGRGRRAGRSAQPRDRPARPERPARLPAHRLGDRHPDRGGRERAAPGRVPGAPSCSWRRLMSTTSSPACW